MLAYIGKSLAATTDARTDQTIQALDECAGILHALLRRGIRLEDISGETVQNDAAAGYTK